MNDKDYEGFVEDIEELLSDLWSLAKIKLDQESDALDELAAMSIFSMGPLIAIGVLGTAKDQLGSESACDYDGTKKKVFSFVEKYCFDYSAVKQAIANLADADKNFDIGDAQTAIAGKLEAAWPADTNETAKLFRDNYVATITSIYGDQKALLALAKEDLEAIPTIVDENRKSIKGTLTATIDELNGFNPRTRLGLDAIHYTLFAWGLVTPDPITGRVSGLIDSVLQDKDSVEHLFNAEVACVADFFTALRGAVDTGKDKAKKVINGCRDTIGTTLSEVKQADELYVLNKPG